ncbi:MAG: pyridoxal-phosphate dependent enzyme, partial [Planctomycetia bacterium]|nr:pyridoxal-phosphate dependent enzyme [Planctomycetia bacterium]
MAVAARTDLAFQQCIAPACRATFSVDEVLTSCPSCGSLLDVEYDWDRLRPPNSFEFFERKWMRRSDPLAFSGVWRFHELLPFAPRESVVTIGEGQTMCPPSDGVAAYAGVRPGRLFLQYEGLNPSGSFKDNGMSAAFTHARMIGARRAACASTGNTSASLAVYCAVTRLMRGIIFIGSGKISYGKLSQALDYGALTIQIAGDFDDAMARVKEVSGKLGIYLVNSVNPFRLEGQTMCPPSDGVARYVGVNAGRLFLQYEGLNPSGSFKDNGMSAAFTHARMIGARRAACASTGNTSASLAIYCAVTRLMRGIIFIGS